MADHLNPTKRSWNMSRIHSKNTKAETTVRKYLFHHGFRYRKNVASLPGKPDIVLKKYNTVIFVNGCFWHRHGCKYTTTPKSHTDFWNEKFNQNIKRDKQNYLKLQQMGWIVLVVWECELKKDKQVETLKNLADLIIKMGG